MNLKSKWEDVVRDLEMLELINIVDDKITLNIDRNINFISKSITMVIYKIITVGDRSILNFSDERILDICLLYGLLREIVIKRVNMGMSIDEANRIDDDYILDLYHVYKTVLKMVKLYDDLKKNIRRIISKVISEYL